MRPNKNTFFTHVIVVIGLSIVYGRLHDNFLLRFIDAMSMMSGLLLAYGLCVYLWKDGVFSFLRWNPKSSSYSHFRAQLQEERKSVSNDVLYSGGFLMVLSILLTIYYVVIH